MSRPNASGGPQGLAHVLRKHLSAKPFTQDTIQWGIVAGVHGSTSTMLTTAASEGDTTIYTAAAPLVNDLLVVGSLPINAVHVTAITGSGPYTVTIAPGMPTAATTGASVTALPTLDVYLNGAQNPTPASALTWGIRYYYGQTPPQIGAVIPLMRGIGGLQSDRFALASGSDWIITGSGPPTAPPPNGTIGVLYIDITNGGLYEWTAPSGSPNGWVQVGGYSPTVEISGVNVDLVTGSPSVTLVAFNATNPSYIEVTANAAPAIAFVANAAAYWLMSPDGGMTLPAADNLPNPGSVVYSSDSVPVSGAFGANGDWDLSTDGTIYYNQFGVWIPYVAGSGSAGWFTDTVASVTYGSPNTVDLTTSGYTSVPAIVSYIPYVGDTVLVATGTTYGSSPYPVVIGALTTVGSTPIYGTITVPAGVTHAQFTLAGAQGAGTYGGQGSKIVATISVSPGETIHLSTQASLVQGGGLSGGSSAGGAAADVRIGGSGLPNRVLVAAGGAGQGNGATASFGYGGEGGGLSGAAQSGGANGGGGAGTGGTQSAGGTGGTSTSVGSNGASGIGGAGGAVGGAYGGGGADGWYGGGGGGAPIGGFGGGGGGGSDYYDPSVVVGTPADYPGEGGQPGYTPPGGAPGSGWISVVWLP